MFFYMMPKNIYIYIYTHINTFIYNLNASKQVIGIDCTDLLILIIAIITTIATTACVSGVC